MRIAVSRKLLIAAVMIGWPIIVVIVGPSPAVAVTSLLIYGVVAWRLSFWAPIVGATIGATPIVLFCMGCDWPSEAQGALLLVCTIGGALLGWFAREMKRLDDDDDDEERTTKLDSIASSNFPCSSEVKTSSVT